MEEDPAFGVGGYHGGQWCGKVTNLDAWCVAASVELSLFRSLAPLATGRRCASRQADGCKDEDENRDRDLEKPADNFFSRYGTPNPTANDSRLTVQPGTQLFCTGTYTSNRNRSPEFVRSHLHRRR